MAAAKTSAAAKRAAAEAAAEAVEITFLGSTFTLPPQLPGTFALDLAALAGGNDGALYHAITSVLDEGQMAEVRELLAECGSETAGAAELGELTQKISAAYGLAEGE